MQKRMPGCSESSFIRSLEDFTISKGRVCLINHVMHRINQISVMILTTATVVR